jgi:hypothetical protein
MARLTRSWMKKEKFSFYWGKKWLGIDEEMQYVQYSTVHTTVEYRTVASGKEPQ